MLGPFQEAAFLLTPSTVGSPIYTDPPIKTREGLVGFHFADWVRSNWPKADDISLSYHVIMVRSEAPLLMFEETCISKACLLTVSPLTYSVSGRGAKMKRRSLDRLNILPDDEVGVVCLSDAISSVQAGFSCWCLQNRPRIHSYHEVFSGLCWWFSREPQGICYEPHQAIMQVSHPYKLDGVIRYECDTTPLLSSSTP